VAEYNLTFSEKLVDAVGLVANDDLENFDAAQTVF
jgi:hypothetical protein